MILEQKYDFWYEKGMFQALKPTYFNLSLLCCLIPYKYVLLVLTFDAVFSHL